MGDRICKDNIEGAIFKNNIKGAFVRSEFRDAGRRERVSKMDMAEEESVQQFV